MASTFGLGMYESQSTTKPPFFNGDNYPIWKNRMHLFIKSNDYLVWDVIEDGPYIPLKQDSEGKMVLKKKVEMSEEERRKIQINDKALHMLFCSFGQDIYSKVSSIESAKEMEPDETVSKMFDRFSTIVNGLKGFGETIPEDKLVRKLLYSLPESWDGKRTVIIEAKNLKTLKLDELVGSLLTREIMKQGREEEKKKEEKRVENLEVEKKKKMGIALKASLLEESSSSEEDELEELAMIAKRFSRFMRSNRGRKIQRKMDFKECPQLKKKGFEKKKKLKAKLATWSDEESSEDDEQEVANLCLMALEEDSSMVTSNSSSFDFTYDELNDAYDEMQEVYDELVEKYKESVIRNKKIISELNDKNDSLSQANLKFEKKILGLKDELKFFQDENVDLNNLLSQSNSEHQKVLDELNKLNESFKNVGSVKHEIGESSKTNQPKKRTNNYKQGNLPKHSRTKRIRSGEHCYKAKAQSQNSWYLDSGCSRHMTGDKSRFMDLKPKSGGVVTFGDNSKGHIKDDIHTSHACLVAQNENDAWLWHRKLGHASISVLEKLVSLDLVRDNLGKFDAKSDEAIFIGYSLTSKAYRVFNKRTLVVEESIHVVFDDNLLPRKISCEDDDVGIINAFDGGQTSKEDEIPTKEDDTQDPPLEALKDLALEEKEVSYPREFNYVKDSEILGDPSKGVTTRSSLRLMNHVSFISCIEPKNIKEALKDDFWIMAMQEELNQFERRNVWTLVDRPSNQSTIGTKWVFRNKLDESGNIMRNKARLVAQGYTQEEGIDFDETYAPVARMEAIRMLLAYACYHDFKLFQMDVKSAFLNGFINEEVYVEQPPGFEDSKFPNHVFKLTKALYGLKQAPRAWYERLSNFLIEKGFEKRQGEFEMSMMGELSFFLGLQIKQKKDGTFINQAKYIKDMLKKFGLENAKPQATPMSSSTKLDKDEGGKCVDSKLYHSMIGSLLYLTASRPDILFSVCLCARFQASSRESHLIAVKRIFRYLRGTPCLCLWYPRDSTFNLHAYSDADYGGCKIDRKSTSGTCQFLGSMLISWFSKKQNSVALSITEAEYISLGSCCSQVLWMKQQLLDYGINVETIPLKCDNTSATCLTKNLIQHSKTKHIEIRHHFIRDHVIKEDVVIEYVDTLNQLADIFTKPLDKERFWSFRRELGLASLS
ncbi:hypothetical protein HRI_004531400 [Hibiscus trionum]|uniref:Reverse transcriptase Ty1/copia-type domain-containing protein n=1 Tax=Hibiscus trionum TaxID=183268 RepID=A0A9W7MQ42_HIBTR|nr:hypothetical protein HRI_004531400 [Hibiscus trionum]